MAKKLVINADDFGLAEDINDGIIECYREEAITDMSLLAVGESFRHAGERAKENKIDRLGAHLALTGSFKCASPAGEVPTLVNGEGRFPGDYTEFFKAFLTGRVKTAEIYKEFKSQLRKIREAGFKITHIDSHHHIHMEPSILKVATGLAAEEGIGYVRFSRERVRLFSGLIDPVNAIRAFLLSSMCFLSGGILKKSGIKHNDYFIGHFKAHNLTRRYILSAVKNIKEGLTEFACHPGYFTERIKKKYPAYRNAAEEIRVLCNSTFHEALKARGVELVSY